MDNNNFVNIASFLPEMAASHPDKRAIVYTGKKDKNGEPLQYTFQQLNRQSDIIARGLEEIGIGRGIRTVLMVKPSLEFFALSIAMIKAGVVPVVVDPGIGIKNLKICLEEAEPEAFIGIPTAHAARILFKWCKGTLKTWVWVSRFASFGGISLEKVKAFGNKNITGTPYSMAKTHPDETAAILFTSGSTGIPKGVVYNHGNFAAQIEILKEISQAQPGEIDLPTFPLFALFDPALGMTSVIPDMDPTRPADVDPTKIINAIHDYGVTNMFASPALLNTVGRYGSEKGIKLPSLKRVISAGAPVHAKIMERFLEMLNPEAKILTPYGATESLPVCCIDSQELLEQEILTKTKNGAGVCVGQPVRNIQLSVISINDESIDAWDESLKVKPGEVGEIAVKGEVVTRSYYNREVSTRLAKISEKDGTGFFHRMGDLGYLDDDGRVWFCGRKSHRVITESETLFTVPCEVVFNNHPQVYRTALVGPKINGRTSPVLCVELESDIGNKSRQKIERELLELAQSHSHTKNIKTILFHPGFPVDIRHNAKIGREKLTVWAENKLS